MRREVRTWFEQAQDDMITAQMNLGMGRYNWACFIAQQAAEKALKGLYVAEHGEEPPRIHGLRTLAQLAAGEAAGAIWTALGGLDRHYTISRYSPDGIEPPAESYSEAIAKEAVEQCSEILLWATARLREED